LRAILRARLSRHDRTQLRAPIEHTDTAYFRQLLSRVPREGACAVSRGLDTHPEGIPRGGAQAEDERVRHLPGLEAPGIRGQLEGVGVSPRGTVHVNQKRMSAGGDGAVGHEEKSDSAGSAQELPGGTREIVTMELAD